MINVLDYFNNNRDKVLFYVSVPCILFWILISLSYVGLFLLTPFFVVKTKEHWEIIKSRMKLPGFGKGFILLTICLFAVSGVMTLIVGGTIVTGPLFPFILGLTFMFVTLRVTKILALLNDDVKVAYPVFLFIGTVGLISVNKLFYLAIKYIIIGGLIDFWAGLGLAIDDEFEMFKPTDNIDVVTADGTAVNVTNDIDLSSTDSTDANKTNIEKTHIYNQSLNGESFISTHNEYTSFAASMNTSNDTVSITTEMINNEAAPSDGITVSSIDGKDSVTFQDNKIYDETNMQVGTYGTDVSNGNIAFKDTAGNNLGSIDPDTCFTYDEAGKQDGSVQNLGAVTTYTDADGHQAYKSNLDGAPVIDSKTGELIATVKKN